MKKGILAIAILLGTLVGSIIIKASTPSNLYFYCPTVISCIAGERTCKNIDGSPSVFQSGGDHKNGTFYFVNASFDPYNGGGTATCIYKLSKPGLNERVYMGAQGIMAVMQNGTAWKSKGPYNISCNSTGNPRACPFRHSESSK